LPIRAFFLVLIAAAAHATWNFLAKQFAGYKHLIWLSSVMEALLFAPFALWIAIRQAPHFPAVALLFLLATGILHLLYTDFLLRGYRAGDFTLVYPLARGSAPLLSFLGAVLLLHEHTSAVAVSGALLISLGILFATGAASSLGNAASRDGVLWGVATGITIACYTIVDAYSVTRLMIAPLLVEYSGNMFRAIFLSRQAWSQRSNLGRELSQCWKGSLGIALLTPAGYILALSAMKLAPVSHVAPVREMSMMMGMYLGARFLEEKHIARRVIGSALIAGGVAALALG
jgi:drug/metabolite transporter (DMT)-like permease